MLALLLVQNGDSAQVARWIEEVLADAPTYVVGESWKPPDDWRRKKQHIVSEFKSWLGGSEADRRAVREAAARFDGAGRLKHPPLEHEVYRYLYLLTHADEKLALAGAGAGKDIKHGAPRRIGYLAPRVAALVRDQRAALEAALDAGLESAQRDSVARGAVPGRVFATPQKADLKLRVAELETTLADEHRAHEATRKRELRAKKERDNAREQLKLDLERRVAAAARAAIETVELARDAALTRARKAEDESNKWRQAAKRYHRRCPPCLFNCP